MTKKKVTYAVYIDEPWKVSNKEKFGATNMTIMELTPQQKHINPVWKELCISIQ